MSLNKIFCTNCGTEIVCDTDKDFCFCTECGNKIILNTASVADAPPNNNPVEQNIPSENHNSSEIDKKLDEVSFYYKLSVEKKEYENFYSEPFYYIKAQDILVDLSEIYPDDYRIWWELCKPIDWLCPLESNDLENKYEINEGYFNRALDKAELPKKRELIEEHDKYIKNKERVKEIAKEKQLEEEKQRAKELEEQKKREKQLEEEKRRAKELEEQKMREKQLEEEKRREKELEEQKIREKQLEEEIKEKEKRFKLEREANLALSAPLWGDLTQKKYAAIDNTYFTLQNENNQTLIGVFKLISNILYLSAFRIDANKSNTVYREQSMAIQFNEKGQATKFDRTPIRIKGLLPPENILQIINNSDGELFVGNMMLTSDAEYISGIMKSAKKPLLAFAQIFI